MRTYKRLLSGGGVMLLAAFLGLVFSPNRTLADASCTSTDCYFTDTTISDFSSGTFYLTGLSNNGDGAVQLVPVGLTANWVGDDYTLPVSRTELAAVIYNNTIYVIGGYDVNGNRIGEVISATTYITGPLKGPWQTVTTLNPALGGMAAVISTTGKTGGYLYVLGGSQHTSSIQHPTVITDAVSYIHFNANGQFDTSWQSGNPMPWPLVYEQAIVHNGYLYVVGGCTGMYTCATPMSDISRAQIDPNTGQLTWDSSNPIASLPLFLKEFAAVVWPSPSGTDYLYIIGGNTGTSGTPNTYYASFDNVGAFSPFTPTGSLPQPFYAHAAVQGNGQIFVTGGLKGISTSPVDDVNSALINVTDGSLLELMPSTYWIPSKVLLEPRYMHASVINSGGIVYVIGGTGSSGTPDESGSNTVYRGETTGFGSLYAESGKYVSRILDLGGPRNITNIKIGSTVTSAVTMTVQYRTGTSQNDFANPSTGWTNLPDSLQAGVNVTTSLGVSLTASMIQYQVFFTGTGSATSNVTPVFNAFQVRYPVLPDFAVTGITASQVPTTVITFTYWIENKKAASAPVRSPLKLSTSATVTQARRPRLPPMPAGAIRRSPAAAATSIDWMFWVSLYARSPTNPPTNPNDLAGALTNCADLDHAGWTGPPFVYVADLSQTPRAYHARCTGVSSSQTFWVQIDTCDITNDSYCTTNGYIQENDEPGSYSDNILGPVTAGGSSGNPGGGGGGGGTPSLFLPFIKK